MIEINSQIKKGDTQSSSVGRKRVGACSWDHVGGLLLFRAVPGPVPGCVGSNYKMPGSSRRKQGDAPGRACRWFQTGEGKGKKKETHSKVGLKSNMIEKRVFFLAADVSFKSVKIIMLNY